MTFSQLSKNCKANMSALTKYRIAILGDCATQHLAIALRGYAYTRGFAFEVFDAGYNQISSQIIDAVSDMYKFVPDTVLIYMCSENLYNEWADTNENERSLFADRVIGRIKGHWQGILSNCTAKIIQFTFVEIDDKAFGNFAARHQMSFIYQIRKLNLMLMNESIESSNVFLVDICGLQSRIGRSKIYDSKLYYSSQITIAPNELPVIAKNVVDVILSFMGVVKKCIVLDLDNTLWGGVIGDDGLSGIEIGALGVGYAFTAFQKWLRELKRRGILLAVCSKNEEKIAKEPFENHSDMDLRLEDFSIFIANWHDKAENIRFIKERLNIGMDSIVFIDDNPFERNLVRSLIPEVIVPELPEDPAEYLEYLQNLNLFETATFSIEDAKRTDYYRAEIKREEMRHQSLNYEEYLQSLEMLAVVAPFDEFHVPRISQLTQRSNQFNLRTIRYTEADIRISMQDLNRYTLYFTLKDKLADHGLIAIVILDKKNDETLFVDTWLMSCRVLKRGMEEFVVNKIIEVAQREGFNQIVGEYVKTTKNAIVADIYEKLGFVRTTENTFTANLRDFKYNKNFIKEQIQ